jgi:hypothetical protein
MQGEEEGAAIRFYDKHRFKRFIESIRYSYIEYGLFEIDYKDLENIKISSLTLINGDIIHDIELSLPFFESTSVLVRDEPDNYTTAGGEDRFYFKTTSGDIIIKVKEGDGEKLFNYLYPDSKQTWRNQISQLTKSSKNENYLSLPYPAFKHIFAQEKANLISKMCEEPVKESFLGSIDAEDYIVQIIKNTDKNKINNLLVELNKGTIIKDVSNRLQNNILGYGEDNYDNFIKELVMLYYSQDISNITDVSKIKYLYKWYKSNEYHISYNLNLNDNGKIEVEYSLESLSADGNSWIHNDLDKYDDNPDWGPLDVIGVEFNTKIDYIGIEDQVMPMPIIYFKWINDNFESEQRKEALWLAFDAMSFAIGIKEVKAAISLSKKSWVVATRLAGLIHASGDLCFELNDGVIDELNQSQKGRTFLKLWDNIGLLLAGTSSVESIINKRIPVFIALKFSYESLTKKQQNLIAKDNELIQNIINELNKEYNKE